MSFSVFKRGDKEIYLISDKVENGEALVDCSFVKNVKLCTPILKI